MGTTLRELLAIISSDKECHKGLTITARGPLDYAVTGTAVSLKRLLISEWLDAPVCGIEPVTANVLEVRI